MMVMLLLVIVFPTVFLVFVVSDSLVVKQVLEDRIKLTYRLRLQFSCWLIVLLLLLLLLQLHLLLLFLTRFLTRWRLFTAT